MTGPLRDDCPPEYRLVRRSFLASGAAVLADLAMPAQLAADTRAAVPAAKFMDVSMLLVNHKLNGDLGARLAVAMSAVHPDIGQDIEDILAVARTNNAKIVEDFFAALPAGRPKESALAIIAAWYTGVVADGPHAEVYAYELALMYQPAGDVMTIPSYAISGPNGWDATAPPLTDMPEF